MLLLEKFVLRFYVLLLVVYLVFTTLYVFSFFPKVKVAKASSNSFYSNRNVLDPDLVSQTEQKNIHFFEAPILLPEPIKSYYQQKKFDSVSIPILMFHHVRDYYNENDLLGMGLSVSPMHLEDILKKIQTEKYSVITFSDILDYYYGLTQLPPNPIVLSFDDGYEDNFVNALPLLQKYSVKGSFSVMTGFMETSGHMNWHQVKILKAYGHEITSHTVSHPDLTKLSEESLRNELIESKVLLDQELLQNTSVLVYPSGRVDARVIEIAKKAGYSLARTTLPGIKVDGTNLYNLPAIRVTNYNMGI